MAESKVQIVTLPAMRVASAWAFGPSPEDTAWQKLQAWAKPKGLLEATEDNRPRVFGFNNPNPSAGSPNYGYEFWLTVGPEVAPEGDIRIGEFGGGLYAVLAIDVIDPWKDIPAGWQQLDAWVHDNGREMGSHQWLEELQLVGPGHLMSLYYALRS